MPPFGYKKKLFFSVDVVLCSGCLTVMHGRSGHAKVMYLVKTSCISRSKNKIHFLREIILDLIIFFIIFRKCKFACEHRSEVTLE